MSMRLRADRIPERRNRMIRGAYVFSGLVAAAATLVASAVSAQTRIGSINTSFRWLGPDDRIIVERFDDPKVQGVSCYLSRAATGGMKGWVGLAEDPSRFSVACQRTGHVTLPQDLPKQETVAFVSSSLFFKSFQIIRMVDPDRPVLVYTVVSTKLVKGSPFNAISVVGLDGP
ncbi:CreA protein [Granulibacter bethesdensis]|nr:CreA protein [Granulibacter bethesdensis]